jgi:sterol 3beta-glucosyltransferase
LDTLTHKIAILASGTRGDVQPYVALGKGLRDAGYTVQILTSDDFEALVTDAGLAFRSTGGSLEAILQQPEWRRTTEGGNFLKIMARMKAAGKRRAEEIARSTPPLLAGSELLIAGMSGLAGGFSIAEKLAIPVVQAYLFPITPTGAFASPLTPVQSLGGPLNRLSFHVMRQLLWQTVRDGDVATRQELGLPAGSFRGPFQDLQRQRAPILYGYSRHVLPRPSDWDEDVRVVGYWFLDSAPDWAPPPDLSAFLAAGPPPVYVGFGSMGNRSPEDVTRLALAALATSGQRGVLASGWGGLAGTALPDTVHVIKSAPHGWLFPQMAAVVHHGGAGTTAAGLRAGVPSIVVPFFGDQPFWGRRIETLGVGPAPIPRRRLTAERLAEAMSRAVSDAELRRRAADLGERIRAEDGVGQAVALVQQVAEGRKAIGR